MCLNILCLNKISQLQCVCVCFRSCGQRRVSGWDDGLQADADGGFLSESWDCAALSQWDWESLLRSAPQRTNAALPNEGRPGRHGRHRSQLSEGGEMAFIIFTVWLQKHFHRYHFTDLPAWTQLFDLPQCLALTFWFYYDIFSVHSCKRWSRKPTPGPTTASIGRLTRPVSPSSRLHANTSAAATPCESSWRDPANLKPLKVLRLLHRVDDMWMRLFPDPAGSCRVSWNICTLRRWWRTASTDCWSCSTSSPETGSKSCRQAEESLFSTLTRFRWSSSI